MSVRLEKYEPVLDVGLRVIEELVRNGDADLVVPLQFPEAVGLAVDVEGLIYKINPYTDIELFIPRQMRTVELFDNTDTEKIFREGKKSKEIVNKRLRIKFVEDDFSSLSEQLFDATLLDMISEEKPQNLDRTKISVTANENKYQKFFNSPLVEPLEENGIQLPPTRDNIKLKLIYHSVTALEFDTIFQDFPPLNTYQIENRTIITYPVSSRKNHLFPFNVWKYIEQPLFWDSWSLYQEMGFLVLAGKETIEQLAEECHENIDHFKHHIEIALPICYEIMEAIITRQSFDPLCDKLKVPKEYRGIFLSRSTKPVYKIANPDSLDDPGKYAQLKNLVERYNIEYALPRGKRTVNIKEVATFKQIKYN